MTGAAAMAGGRVTRWLLLVCTVLGLAAMHTLGHAGMGGGGHAPAMSSPATAVVQALTGDAACDGDHCPGMPGHSGGGAWSACLAILTGLATVALLAFLLLRLVRRGGGLLRRLVPAGTPPRAPPSHSTGLTIGAAAVLRI